MNPTSRPRRAALLCVHFVRNLAFYRAGWKNGQPIFPKHDIWATINSNFLDVAVLEWCKLFADNTARHDWRKVVVAPGAFMPQFLLDTGTSQSEWAVYLGEMRTYRDKFIAHLDEDPTMNIPSMDLAEKSIQYFYDTIKGEQSSDVFIDLPANLRDYRDACQSTAESTYNNAT